MIAQSRRTDSTACLPQELAGLTSQFLLQFGCRQRYRIIAEKNERGWKYFGDDGIGVARRYEPACRKGDRSPEDRKAAAHLKAHSPGELKRARATRSEPLSGLAGALTGRPECV